MSAPLLDVRDLHKRFGGLAALDGINFTVGASEIVGIVGPNGSGKSTLLNVLSGIYSPDQGEVILGGKRVDGSAPHVIAAAGLGRTFQNLQLSSGLTLAENVLLGAFHRQRATLVGALIGSPASRRENRQTREEASHLLARVGLAGRDGEALTSLSYGQRRLLEIARALATHPRVLMLDEPCAGLSQGEADALARLISELASEQMAIILIEHNMRFVLALVERMLVLNFGRLIAAGTPAAMRQHPEVIEAYLGNVRHAAG